jgi:hypothetical protein
MEQRPLKPAPSLTGGKRGESVAEHGVRNEHDSASMMAHRFVMIDQ